MDDAGAVRGDERLGELRTEPHDVGRRQGIGPDIAERLPLDELHDEEIAAVLLVEIVDGGDVRVVEPR